MTELHFERNYPLFDALYWSLKLEVTHSFELKTYCNCSTVAVEVLSDDNKFNLMNESSLQRLVKSGELCTRCTEPLH